MGILIRVVMSFKYGHGQVLLNRNDSANYGSASDDGHVAVRARSFLVRFNTCQHRSDRRTDAAWGLSSVQLTMYQRVGFV